MSDQTGIETNQPTEKIYPDEVGRINNELPGAVQHSVEVGRINNELPGEGMPTTEVGRINNEGLVAPSLILEGEFKEDTKPVNVLSQDEIGVINNEAEGAVEHEKEIGMANNEVPGLELHAEEIGVIHNVEPGEVVHLAEVGRINNSSN